MRGRHGRAFSRNAFRQETAVEKVLIIDDEKPTLDMFGRLPGAITDMNGFMTNVIINAAAWM